MMKHLRRIERARRAASNLWLRIGTALLGIPLLVGALWLGGWVFTGVVLMLAGAGIMESYRLLRLAGLPAYRSGGLVLGLLLVLMPVWPPALPLAIVWGVGLLVRAPFRQVPLSEAPVRLAATAFGALYPAALLSSLLALRLHPGPTDQQAFWITLGLLVMIWAADTLAYATGRLLGKRPLAPRISPAKTWEGFVGGLLGALGAAIILRLSALHFLAWPHVLVLGVLCGSIGPPGDLAESLLKRAAGVKDSGNLLPGHGGVLDRFDALMVVAPLAYCYLRWVAGVYG
ncbi:phosphatidate cytidylyltransferase [Rhodothermus profundi]|uniref:Phosphatidate cytidylyltransferase n=1 Tax=Rhodothermus profundi TaxID=633813 RepID=A0A1M6WLL6_9BACT|nr:phosphatidate cytidylyltransferase [Rhodothermus profundi]SHK94693.1 phosphatidate cytidylyltransferase [Rhodothermus profundi]